MTSEGDHRRTLGLPSQAQNLTNCADEITSPPAALAQAGARLIRARSAGEDTSGTLWGRRSRDSVYESSWAPGGTTAYQSPRAAPPGTSCRDTVLQVRVSVLQVYTGAFSPQHCFDDAGFWPQGGRGYRTPAGGLCRSRRRQRDRETCLSNSVKSRALQHGNRSHRGPRVGVLTVT